MKLKANEALILERVADGKCHKEIADEIGRSKEYVNMTLSRLRARYSLRNTPHMLAQAFREKLIA